jgi:nucleoside-diphosphate-sugar epimerase
MRVLVLGGTGQTGPFLVRRLHQLGHEVTIFHRGEHEADFPGGVRHIHGELKTLPPELAGLSPDVVVHMWAMTEADAATFAEIFHGAAGRAVVISSCDVYRAYGRLQHLESGPPDPIPLAEDAPLRESRYPYRNKTNTPLENSDAYDKILVERASCQFADLPVTILRFPAVYGPHDYHRFGPWIHQMDSGSTELKIQDTFAQWRWTHGYVENIAEAVILSVTNPRAAGRIFNVGESHTPTWYDRISEIGRLAGWKGRIALVPASKLPEAQRNPADFSHHLVIDSSRIRSELHFREVIPHEESLLFTLAWERKQG